MRCNRPVLVNLIGRSDSHIEEGVLITILTLTATISHQRQGVGLRVVAVLQRAVQIVGISQQRGEGIDIFVILIRIEQRTLNQRQESRRGNHA